jgi:transcriptional regulator with XRE-family HTH domain
MDETSFRKSLSRSVRRTRHERGLTQRSLADRSGITQKYLSRIERGQVTPSSLVAFRLCSALSAELGELVPRRAVPARPGIGAVVRLLTKHSDQEVDRVRRMLLELFR